MESTRENAFTSTVGHHTASTGTHVSVNVVTSQRAVHMDRSLTTTYASVGVPGF